MLEHLADPCHELFIVFRPQHPTTTRHDEGVDIAGLYVFD